MRAGLCPTVFLRACRIFRKWNAWDRMGWDIGYDVATATLFNGSAPSLLSPKASRSAGLFQRKISPTATTILLWPDQPLQYYEFNNIACNCSSISISSCTWQEHKKIQVSLRRGLYIVRRPINLITRNAYSYASTPVTIIPTLMWCPQREP